MKKKVEVLLRENIEDVGRCGDLVQVAPGFARNYLLPRKLAIEANEENKRAMLRRRARLDAEDAAQVAELQVRVAALSGVVLRTSGRADESGHLYGSVNAKDIAALLHAAGQRFEEKDVRLDAHLKALGPHTVRVHVHGETFAEIRVEVSAEAVTS